MFNIGYVFGFAAVTRLVCLLAGVRITQLLYEFVLWIAFMFFARFFFRLRAATGQMTLPILVISVLLMAHTAAAFFGAIGGERGFYPKGSDNPNQWSAVRVLESSGGKAVNVDSSFGWVSKPCVTCVEWVSLKNQRVKNSYAVTVPTIGPVTVDISAELAIVPHEPHLRKFLLAERDPQAAAARLAKEAQAACLVRPGIWQSAASLAHELAACQPQSAPVAFNDIKIDSCSLWR